MAEQTNSQQPNPNQQTPPPPNNNQKKVVKIVLIVVGVLVVLTVIGTLLLGAIGLKVGEKIFENASNTEIERNGDGIQINSDDGSLEVGTSTLPQDFPEVAPLYEPHELASSSSYATGDGKVWAAYFTTNDQIDDVYGFYEDEFDSEAWEIQSTTNYGDTRTISAVNEEEALRTTVNVSAAEEGSEFSVTTTHTTESEQ